MGAISEIFRVHLLWTTPFFVKNKAFGNSIFEIQNALKLTGFFEKVLEIPSFFLIFEKMPQKFCVVPSFLRKVLEIPNFSKSFHLVNFVSSAPPIYGQNLEWHNEDG